MWTLPACTDSHCSPEFFQQSNALSKAGWSLDSSTARSPVRVTIEVPRVELDSLAELLDEAQTLIEELRQGLGLVPDSLPDAL